MTAIRDTELGKMKISFTGVLRLFSMLGAVFSLLLPLTLAGNEAASASTGSADPSGETVYCKMLEEPVWPSKHCYKSKLVYYLYVEDFADSFIEIPTSNLSEDGSTISSKYLAGRAAIYNANNEKAGTCSASFLCMQNEDGIYTDISNYLSADNGLVVSWFTPTTLVNLELDSIIHGMVTECIVVASTKIGFNPFYGKTFNLDVSSDDGKIYFEFTKR